MLVALPETKVCNRCGEEKGASAFFSHHDARDGRDYLSAACRPCTAARLKEWRAANRDRHNANQSTYHAANRDKRNARKREIFTDPAVKARVRGLRREATYGVTVEQYNEMLERQNGVCAICRSPETMTYKGTIRFLGVDHDHVTGRVRGLLCVKCNAALGMFGEDPVTIVGALDYLTAHDEEEN